MSEIAEIVENRLVNNYIYDQLKKIKKNKINATSILIRLGSQITGEYNFSFTSEEMIIKIDRKKDITEIRNKITQLLKNLIPPTIDINFIFKILSGNGELTIRPKRNV